MRLTGVRGRDFESPQPDQRLPRSAALSCVDETAAERLRVHRLSTNDVDNVVRSRSWRTRWASCTDRALHGPPSRRIAAREHQIELVVATALGYSHVGRVIDADDSAALVGALFGAALPDPVEREVVTTPVSHAWGCPAPPCHASTVHAGTNAS